MMHVVLGCCLLVGLSSFQGCQGASIITAPDHVKDCHVSTTTTYADETVHWERLRKRYDGCTHVFGDLVINFLESTSINYDLSFLRDIRYVSGHVAIFANNFPAVVALPSLQVIRGNSSFSPSNGFNDVTLLIGAHEHTQIYMPKLQEISSGNAYILLGSSPHLCYIHTVDWSLILREGVATFNGENNAICGACSQACDLTDSWKGHCWGPGDDACQLPAGFPAVQRGECASECNGRCSSSDPTECCHTNCAIGCVDPSPRHCLMCRDYQMQDGECVAICPLDEPRSYPWGQHCVQY